VPGQAADVFPAGFERLYFTHGRMSREVLRAPLKGPVVILIHEGGGINNGTITLANMLSNAGLSPVLPVLVDRPRPKPSKVQVVRNIVGLCVAREFAAFASNKTTPIVIWLRALAREEYKRASGRGAGGRGVGVIGMCFSGGFALAMVADPVIVAAVSGEPALPWALPRRRTELAMSAAELDVVAARANDGFCVRTLRYQNDFKSPGVRMRFIEEMLPNVSVVEIPSRNPNKHSVLADALEAPENSELARALTGTVAYLVERLIP
jgi:dienelactone hydrolase